MKRPLLGLAVLLLILGAGCAKKPPTACQWLPQSDVENVVGGKIATLDQPVGADGLTHQCTYRFANGLPVFSVTQDNETADQFMVSIRNIFPTQNPPDMTQNIGVGDSSVLVHYHDTIYILFVRTGSTSYILSNVSYSPLTDKGLTTLAKELLSRQ